VDALMCGLQSAATKVEALRLRLLPVRVGVARVSQVSEQGERGGRRVMAKIIEFYVPSCFRKSVKWTPLRKQGKVIEFTVGTKTSA
jgi:hypothetical protein